MDFETDDIKRVEDKNGNKLFDYIKLNNKPFLVMVDDDSYIPITALDRTIYKLNELLIPYINNAIEDMNKQEELQNRAFSSFLVSTNSDITYILVDMDGLLVVCDEIGIMEYYNGIKLSTKVMFDIWYKHFPPTQLID